MVPRPTYQTDLDLVQRHLAGDSSAEKVLLKRLRCVRSFVASQNYKLPRPLDPDELEDIGQEAITLLWTKLDQYSGHGPLEAFAFRFCYLQLRSGLRRRQRQPQLIDDSRELVPEPAADPVMPPVFHEDLYGALDSLDRRESDIIRMHCLQSLTFEEIARQFACPLGSVKTWYYRGLLQLRTKVEDPTSCSGGSGR